MAVWVVGKYSAVLQQSLANQAESVTGRKKSKELSKLCDSLYEEIKRLLVDSFWKVRTAACISISCMGKKYISQALPILLKAVKSGSVNRTICAETIVKMGRDGERMLVEIIKRMRVKDSALICPILQSLEMVDLAPNGGLDFVLEEMINGAKSDDGKIRKSCLISLRKIKERVDSHNHSLKKAAELKFREQAGSNDGKSRRTGRHVLLRSSYLSFESLMDVFYFCLKDSVPGNREVPF